MKVSVAFFSCLIVLASTLLPNSHAGFKPDFNPIRLGSDHLLDVSETFSCRTWHWAVETNNWRDWKVVPWGCVEYVKHYMIGGYLPQYNEDLKLLALAVRQYLDTLPTPNNTQAVVFDLSDTLLSNLPYYERPDVCFGGKPFDRRKFNAWVQKGEAPAVPYMQKLFNDVWQRGYKVVVITGSSGKLRSVLQNNLKSAGFGGRYSMILKTTAISTREFKIQKRKQLVEGGYTIVANIGDQWRDITGDYAGNRTFKVPNPMYYLG